MRSVGEKGLVPTDQEMVIYLLLRLLHCVHYIMTRKEKRVYICYFLQECVVDIDEEEEERKKLWSSICFVLWS